MTKVLMVGSAEQSGGGVASVLRLMKTMPFWKKYQCGWLGTQIQRGYGEVMVCPEGLFQGVVYDMAV